MKQAIIVSSAILVILGFVWWKFGRKIEGTIADKVRTRDSSQVRY